MTTVALLLTALLSVMQNPQMRPLSFTNLKSNQSIEVEWRYRACFSSNNYDLSFRGIYVQIEARDLAEVANHKAKYSQILLTNSELKEWDEMLAEYRAEGRSKCGTSEESLTISLYEKDQLISKEEFQNKCASSKLWDFITALKQRSFK